MTGVGLPEALERAAGALDQDADSIRPANGDPVRLLEMLDTGAAARVIRWLLEHQPEDAAELAAAWADDPERGAAALLAVSEEGLPKVGRKALRRVHHQLRSRGVSVPDAERAEPVVAVLPPVEQPLDEALITPLDPRGTRGAYLVTSHPSGGARMFELLIDESRGVLDCRVYSAGRSKVRRFLRDFTEHERFPAVPVPSEAVRALVRRIVAAQPADRPAPRSFAEWRGELTAAPEGAATPGELAREALGEGSGGTVKRAVELVQAGELGPWPPSAEALQTLAERISEAAESRVIVSGAARAERARDVLREGLAELFAEPAGARTAACFEESAFVLWKGGREQEARAALAAARAFREQSPGENPVAEAIAEVVLAPVLQKAEESVEEGQGDEGGKGSEED